MNIHSTSPIIVVSNRLPFVVSKDAETGNYKRNQRFTNDRLMHDNHIPTEIPPNGGQNGERENRSIAGGLVTAVAPVVVETQGMWVGWPGICFEGEDIDIPEADPGDQSPTAGLKSEQVIPVNIDKTKFDEYYNGMCNACFWPLFHSMPDRALFQKDKWESYCSVNQEFAALTVKGVRKLKEKYPNSVPLVWIHDYHLMMAANHIREACNQEGLEIKLAFFLHIPFPSWDIMRLFPWKDELLQGILLCDSIGFHIEDYCSNFIECCQRTLGCRIDRDQMLVLHNMRTVSVNALPISIPYERFSNLAEKAEVVVKNKDEEQLILGVDRLDYTKGLVNRLRAFEKLLEKYPEHLGHVTFLQVAVPSRTDVKEYQELKEELDQLIGSVNGRFSTPNWSPIRYIYGCVSQDQLAAFYRDASVCVVTPLRDGMNLVAKEFVACQTGEPGVLLLSPFAGAGTSMLEALLVNPYETNEFADILNRALTMSKDEKELRMKLLRCREKRHDVNFWLRSFLKSVECLQDDESNLNRLHAMLEDDFEKYLSKYIADTSLVALLLDYDGTLAPMAPHPDLAVIPSETKKILERLAGMPDVNIAIISGRSLDNVMEMVGIKGITYAGNHGLDILHHNGTKYTQTVSPVYLEKLEVLKKNLSVLCTNGAWMEDKVTGLTFHYREVPKADRSTKQAQSAAAFADSGLKKYQAHMAHESKPPTTWNKGRAAIHILKTLYGDDWSGRVSVIFAGDDVTDEDAIIALNGMAVTFRITEFQNVRTAAKHRLVDTDSVYKMLKWLERRLGFRAPPVTNGFRSRSTSFNDQGISCRNSPPSSLDFQNSPTKTINCNVLDDVEYHKLVKRNSPPSNIVLSQ